MTISMSLDTPGRQNESAKDSDRPEGQELGGWAVGGQEGLQEVKF